MKKRKRKVKIVWKNETENKKVGSRKEKNKDLMKKGERIINIGWKIGSEKLKIGCKKKREI